MNDESRDPNAPESEAPQPAAPELPRWARQAEPGNELSDERMRAYFGPKWEKTYRKKLSPFLEDPSFVPTWNWPAAIAFPPAWFLYRKLYLPFALFFLVPQFAFRLLTDTDVTLTPSDIGKPENAWLVNMSVAIQIASSLAAGGTANWFLFRRARAASRLVSLQGVPAGEGLDLMRRMGGVNRTATTFFVVLMLTLTLMQFGG